MKNLMITAAASALIFGAAACTETETEYGETSYDETQTAEMTNETDETAMDDEVLMAETDTDTDVDMMDVETVYLTSTELSADELIGAPVIGSTGDDIATVDDFLIGPNGEIKSVIFRESNFLDAIGDKGALPFNELDLTMNAGDEARFTVAMTEEAIENVEEFSQDGLNDYRLASEMIGTTAEFINSDESIRINDIILTENGQATYAIVGDMMDDERQLAFNRINVEQGDGGEIIIDAAYDDLETMPIFKYHEDVDADGYSDDDDLEDDMDIDADASLDADTDNEMENEY
ncbi:MAG: PRC-barrel domain-containing protein [Henriciella sp.]|uniref:PRC-barrel domain-containing protein n=1 Tax=Henriciella sp. TaxID=1968823 RepID=UPI003C76A213